MELEKNWVAELGLGADALWPQSPYSSFCHPHSWPEAISVGHTPRRVARVRSALTSYGDLPRPCPRPWP